MRDKSAQRAKHEVETRRASEEKDLAAYEADFDVRTLRKNLT